MPWVAAVPWSISASVLVGLLVWVVAGATRRLSATIAVAAAAALAGAVSGGSASRPASLANLAEHDGGLDGPWRTLGRVVREPTAAARGSALVVDVDRVWVEGRWQSFSGRVELQLPQPAPRPNWYSGTQVEAWLRLRRDRPPANPARVLGDRLQLRGIDLRSRLKSYDQIRLRAPPAFTTTLPGRARDRVRADITTSFRRHPHLMRALLLGERRDLDAPSSRDGPEWPHSPAGDLRAACRFAGDGTCGDSARLGALATGRVGTLAFAPHCCCSCW